jgi:hypothetical protein
LLLLQNFARVAAPLIEPRDRILVFNDFPAGYLLAGVRLATNSPWLPTALPGVPADRGATFRYWETTGRSPDVVLLLRKSEVAGDPLVERLGPPDYLSVADLGFARLLRRQASH